MQGQNEFLSVSGAARLLKIAAQTVREWERQGRLRAIKTETGTRIFRRDQVMRLAEEERKAKADEQ
jgi:excisionase family DNA binding protein